MLTDNQIDLIKRSTSQIGQPDRDRVLRSIADRLRDLPQPTDFDVACATNFV